MIWDIPVAIRVGGLITYYEAEDSVGCWVVCVGLKVIFIHQSQVLAFVVCKVDDDLVSFGHRNHKIRGTDRAGKKVSNCLPTNFGREDGIMKK